MKRLLSAALILTSLQSYAMVIEEASDVLSKDQSSIVTAPTLGGGILISSKSNENGVCKALGYERAAVGSMVKDSSYRGPMVIINKAGEIHRGDVATDSSGTEIRKIICLNSSNTTSLPKTIKVSWPKHGEEQIPFSWKSNENGVCKSLGYERAAVGSIIKDSAYRGPMVRVNGAGEVRRGDIATASKGYDISALVCIAK